MTLSSDFYDALTTNNTLDGSTSNLDSLYCTHLWLNTNLRKEIINVHNIDNKMIKYCYTCKGKIRKYEVKSSNVYVTKNYSTPNGTITIKDIEVPFNEQQENFTNGNDVSTEFSFNENSVTDIKVVSAEINRCIPSISHQIDSNIRQKYTSYEMHPNDITHQRLRKSLKGIGCIVNFSLTDGPVKKRTQIQACSISVMIIAIVVISFIMVNFTTPNFSRAKNVINTIVVPTHTLDFNETSSAIINTDFTLSSLTETNTTEYVTTESVIFTNKNFSLFSNVISKIRKNIRIYSKDAREIQDSKISKDVTNRDLSPKFCSCQTNEVCMLDENSGTSICRKAVDLNDPTGCGGLCALETEACQLVDRARDVRVCRLLTLITCLPSEWRCRNGLCVSAEARCDGLIQCYDRSDEMHCGSNLYLATTINNNCGQNKTKFVINVIYKRYNHFIYPYVTECDLKKQFRCGHSISCFPNTKLCNGIIDCWDGYDEVNCTTECPVDQFTCTDGQCILPSRFCDGLADCADGSDEPHGCGGGCGTHEIQCKNQRCVPRSVRCDGHDNCGDSTDELFCS